MELGSSSSKTPRRGTKGEEEVSNNENKSSRGDISRSHRKKSISFTKKCTDNATLEQSYQTSQLAKDKKEAEKMMMKECSFSPTVKPLPRAYGPNKTAGSLVYNRLTKWEKAREVDMKQKMIQRAHEEVKGCTFKPHINRKAPKLPGEKSATARLYEESAMIAANKARLAEEIKSKENEEMAQECTFKPRLCTKRGAWTRVEPKYNQPVNKHMNEGIDQEKENYTYIPKVNNVTSDMISASLYLNRDVTDRLSSHPSSPPQKQKPKNRTIIGIESFLAGPNQIEAELEQSKQENEGPACASEGRSYLEDTECSRPKMSQIERQRNKENFEKFLSRQKAAQSRKELQIEELKKSLYPKPRFEVNEESKKIITKTQKGEFLDRLSHDVEVRNERKKEKPLISEEYTFKPALNPYRKRDEDRTDQHKPDEDISNVAEAYSMGKVKPSITAKDDATENSTSTFQPLLSTKSYKHSKSKIGINPSAYLKQHEVMQAKKKAQQEQFEKEKMEKELQECTFAPSIKECPKFVSDIAKTISVIKSVKTTNIPPPKEAWK